MRRAGEKGIETNIDGQYFYVPFGYFTCVLRIFLNVRLIFPYMPKIN